MTILQQPSLTASGAFPTERPLQKVGQKASLVKRVGAYAKFIACVFYDSSRYLKYAALTGKGASQGQLLALIMKDTHRVEKGLAFLAPRPGFGARVVKVLIPNVLEYHSRFGHHPILLSSLGVLEYWSAFSAKSDSNAELRHAVEDTSRVINDGKTQGIEGYESTFGAVPQTRKSVLSSVAMDVELLFRTRRSVRQYSDQEVSDAEIQRAVRIAQYSPSVCNRQSGRVHVYRGAEKIKDVLSFQRGNAGFGDSAKAIIVVTTDLETFSGPRERYQGWIDGGLFSMSLLMGLHSQGLGACPLNWSASPTADRALRSAHNIAGRELIIMLIAVGHLREDFSVAASPRVSLDHVLRWH